MAGLIIERRWESLAAIEAALEQALTDPEYAALIAEGAGIIESTHVELSTPLP